MNKYQTKKKNKQKIRAKIDFLNKKKRKITEPKKKKKRIKIPNKINQRSKSCGFRIKPVSNIKTKCNMKSNVCNGGGGGGGFLARQFDERRTDRQK